MAVSAEKLQRELDQVSTDYQDNFAGQSRATRDPEMMMALVKRVEAIVSQVDHVPTSIRGADLDAVRVAAKDAQALYQAEHTAILRARDAGPELEQFAEFASTANFTFSRYTRHFAGQNRSTRDAGLLAEFVEDLKACEKRMTAINREKPSPEFGRDIQVVQASIAQYQKELAEIGKAVASGNPDDRASRLGLIANSQFETYANHFAGKSRTTRRPALLQRVIDNLRRVLQQMQIIQEQGFKDEFHLQNLQIVKDQLGMYEKEIGEIRTARQGTSMGDLLGLLGGAANELFAEYREHYAGKDRGAVDLPRLGKLCDGLFEIRRQMLELGGVEPSESNDQNIGIVTDQLSMFESEYEAIATVKKQGGAQSKGVSV